MKKSQARRTYPVEMLVGSILGISLGTGFAYMAFRVVCLWEGDDRVPILVVIVMIFVAIIAAWIKICRLSQPVHKEPSSTVLTIALTMVVMVHGTPTLPDDLQPVLKIGGLLFLFLLSATMLRNVFSTDLLQSNRGKT